MMASIVNEYERLRSDDRVTNRSTKEIQRRSDDNETDVRVLVRESQGKRERQQAIVTTTADVCQVYERWRKM